MNLMKSLPEQPPIYQSSSDLPTNDTDGSLAVVVGTPPTIWGFDGSMWTNLTGGSPVTGSGTPDAIVYFVTSTTVASIGPLITGQVLAGSTGNPPVATSTPSLQSISLTANTNQLFLGTTNVYTITTAGLSANRIFTLPDASCNPIQSLGSATANNWVDYIDSSGVQHISQPAFSNISGTLGLTQGGTGQTSATAAFTALSPMTTKGDMIYEDATPIPVRIPIGSIGNVMTVSASNIPSWAPPATSGTVTSVGMTVPTFLSISGSPITSSGTLGLSLSGTALPVLNGGTGTTTSTGSGNTVLSSSPTLVTPILGTPQSGNLANCTGFPASGITGILPITNGGTNSGTALNNSKIIVSTGSALVEGNQSISASQTQSGTSYVVVSNDFGKLVRLTNTAARAVTLPTTPVDGYWINLEDTAGTSYTANITLTAGGSDIFTQTGNGTYIISSEYASLLLFYNASAATWEII